MNKKSAAVLLQDLQSAEEKNAKNVDFNKRHRNRLLGLVLLVIFIQLFFSFTQIFSPSIHKWVLKRRGSGLMGVEAVQPISKPVVSFKKIFSGHWQKQFELWFNHFVPFKAWIVRGHNQFYFQLLATGHPKYIVLGKKGYLFGTVYNEKYYNTLRTKYSQETFDRWADDLQALANFFARRGQQFLYFITPSKSTYYPEYLPVCHRCEKDGTRPDYHLVTNTLKKRGFEFVDGSAMVLSLKKDFGDSIFPKGGIHWTDLGAAYAAQVLAEEISRRGSRYSLPSFTFDYKLDSIQGARRWSSDADYLNLAGLLSPPLDYMVPEVLVSAPRVFEKKLKLAIVGGSFAGQPAKILAKTKFFKQIDIFNYLIVSHDRYVPDSDMAQVVPMKISNQADIYHPEDYQDLFNADVVILEENEQNLRSNHFKLLLKRILGKEAQY